MYTCACRKKQWKKKKKRSCKMSRISGSQEILFSSCCTFSSCKASPTNQHMRKGWTKKNERVAVKKCHCEKKTMSDRLRFPSESPRHSGFFVQPLQAGTTERPRRRKAKKKRKMMKKKITKKIRRSRATANKKKEDNDDSSTH